MRSLLKSMAVCALGTLLLAGCSKEPDGLPTVPTAQPTATDITAAPAAAPEAVAPLTPPPGSAAAAVIAEPAPLTEGDLLGGNGRPLTEEEKMLLNYGIDMFKNDKGHYPKDLSEAVAFKYITRLPKLPSDEQFSYDPLTGKVTVVKK